MRATETREGRERGLMGGRLLVTNNVTGGENIPGIYSTICPMAEGFEEGAIDAIAAGKKSLAGVV